MASIIADLVFFFRLSEKDKKKAAKSWFIIFIISAIFIIALGICYLSFLIIAAGLLDLGFAIFLYSKYLSDKG